MNIAKNPSPTKQSKEDRVVNPRKNYNNQQTPNLHVINQKPNDLIAEPSFL